MNTITLCYHDLVNDDVNASGFPTAAAATYKIGEDQFCSHIEAIAHAADSNGDSPATQSKYLARLTFDDGGASSCRIADILDRRGLRGYFFIPTDYIGRPSFVTAHQILDLRTRGHTIGSHSCSHQGRMSYMPHERLMREWTGSVAILSDLIGERVTAASVPSGYYSRRVAQAAASAGVTLLFTLEPTLKIETVGACVVVGRYLIRRTTSAEDAAALASGAPLPRLWHWIAWNAKKPLKAMACYTRARNLYFETRRKLIQS